MGDVKEAVKGKPKVSPRLTKGNLVERVSDLRDEVSALIEAKDDDTLDEGNDARAENTRKAGTLRASHSLLTATQNLLEDY